MASIELPQLPVASMNADHVREAKLVNEVEAALDAHTRGEGTLVAVIEKLSVLAVHTREHFLREESMMREGGFPAYAAHKAEHDRMLADVDAEVRLFREKGDATRLARFLRETLPAWYVSHTRTMDQVTSRYAAERRP